MGNIVQTVYNYITRNVENTSSNLTHFNHNQTGTVNMDLSIKKEASIKDKSLNWHPVTNCFTGREDILEEIKKEFTTKKCVVLHGMPGIGKSETARQFGTRYCDSFNGNLIWIFSETSDNIKQCFDNLATSLNLKITKNTENTESTKITDASQVFNKFKSSAALFVFDNAESMKAIQNYLPCHEIYPTVHVLITSRHSNWKESTSISKIQLNSLNTEDALSIFKQKLGSTFGEYELEKWKELVEKLDGIPLGLQIISSLIQQEVRQSLLTVFDLENFIKELETKLKSSTTSESEQDYYKKSVYAAINSVLSRFEKIEAISSLDLLRFVAYLNADNIDDDVLLLIPSINGSIKQLEEPLRKLLDYALIQIVEQSDSSRIKMKINVHRTVQLVLRDYDLTKRNGDMFKTLLGLSGSSELDEHNISIFKYANQKEFLEKTKEFYYENIENASLIEKYIEKLVYYNCNEASQITLPEFMNNRTDNFIQMLFRAIQDADFTTIQVFFKSAAKTEEDLRQINALTDWRSTEFIDALLRCNNLKDYIIFKKLVTGRFFHLLILTNNKKNVQKTIECIDHLTSKWDLDIFYQNDDLDNILHIACRNENISFKIIYHLLQLKDGELKIAVNFENKDKKTPLHYLLTCNRRNSDQFEIYRCFIYIWRAHTTINDKDGYNILFHICENGSFEMIELILERTNRFQINEQDEDGDVAFSKLFRNDSIKHWEKRKLFNLFLMCGMDINLKNKKNKTLLEIAEEKGDDIFAEVIKNHLEELEYRQNAEGCSDDS